ncbi:Tol-Pal system-associated acyl-CoA thioesterase [hydrothermal vent metagenome]|uniref:Tol-Pal system-associated acyl-CoA thioesterase n=1 Tax=hydrothermal vent metagenome TaxID=652676 RepID=A0A3B1B310_9ZZZZ
MAEFSPHSGFIKNGQHILPLRVYYEDTDAGGVVYHANYLKFMERGRSDMIRSLGISQEEMLKFLEPGDIKFVVIRSEVDYVKPAKLDDEITVHTNVSKLGKASLVMGQEIRRSDEVLAKGIIKVAALNEENKPARLPKKILEKINEVIKE